MSDKQSVPTGVKIIAVLYYIGTFFGIIFGLLFLVGAGALNSVANKIPSLGVLGTLGAGLFIIGGIIVIGLGVLSFFIGRGLWKAKNWARIVAIVFAALGILMSMIMMIMMPGSIVSNIFNLVIDLLIGGYLLFSKDVKQAFA